MLCYYIGKANYNQSAEYRDPPRPAEIPPPAVNIKRAGQAMSGNEQQRK